MKKYQQILKQAGISLLITAVLVLVLSQIGFLLIEPKHVTENTILFIMWWGVISLPVFGWKKLVSNRSTVFKIVGLVVFFILTLVMDQNMEMPDNPLTITLITAFWLTVVYTVVPKFFLKYSKYIIATYALILGYFIYVRLSTPSFEVYWAEKKETALLLFFLPIPVLIVIWVYEQWRWVRSLQSDKANTELALLRAQINPHFFFNTLNNLYSLTIKQSEKAPEVILKLSEMMRYTIYEGENPLVPIKEEITYLNNYIELHKIRYKKEVDITFDHDIDGELRVAPLLFINLLENAFKHGIESQSEGAFLKIELTGNEEEIHFSLTNNFDPVSRAANEQGIGLKNLQRRLNLLYPKRHTLKISEEGNIFHTDLTLQPE